MRGSIGIVIGLVIGAGGMYLALRPPWGGQAAAPAPAEDVIATAPTDAGVAAKPKKKRPRRGGTSSGGGGNYDTTGDDYEVVEPEPIKLSATDRRLEWRGEDVRLPPSRIDMEAGGDARPLDDSEIASTVSSQSDAVNDCVTKGAAGTDLRATITIKLLVDGNGRVTRSKLHAPRYLFEQGLLTCAQRALKQMKFPATGAPTLVTVPVTLG